MVKIALNGVLPTWPENMIKANQDTNIHSVCFINNVYKQRFFGLVKIFENLNNRTSQKFHAKQQMEIS